VSTGNTSKQPFEENSQKKKLSTITIVQGKSVNGRSLRECCKLEG